MPVLEHADVDVATTDRDATRDTTERDQLLKVDRAIAEMIRRGEKHTALIEMTNLAWWLANKDA